MRRRATAGLMNMQKRRKIKRIPSEDTEILRKYAIPNAGGKNPKSERGRATEDKDQGIVDENTA